MKFLLFFLCLFCSLPAVLYAQVDISPKLVVFNKAEIPQNIIVQHSFNTSKKITLEPIHYRQDENGQYTKLEKPLSSKFNPDKFIEITPQEIELEPSQKKHVQLSLKNWDQLEDGEYRFHLKAIEDIKERSEEKEGISIQFQWGISIPVVIRKGVLNLETQLKDVSLKPFSDDSQKPQLHVTAFRQGSKSALGKINVLWSEEGQDFEKIGELNNFNIFTDISHRKAAIHLTKLPKKGILKIYYLETLTGELLDEISITL